ncbi:hypothetical protein Lsha_1313 [Legionella shakespearei DSM 23087]|uniref:Type VII secretion system protein EssD-like domain-containing protein n=2 Tax=Legionella shakespearei TaxID=45075 RepID=A0A0W0YW00_9GAMM|nr:hypothetical protein Lsha_1313 [Legionella shakespearei DSM 23087]
MIDEIIAKLTFSPGEFELAEEDWLQFSSLYHEADVDGRIRFSNAITSCSGVPESLVQSALDRLCHYRNADSDAYEKLISELQTQQSNATEQINRFLQRPFFNHLDLSPLAISRNEWLLIIKRFEQQNRHAITMPFFIDSLSCLRRTRYSDLMACLNSPQPGRQVKRKFQTEQLASRKIFHRYQEDDGVNPLVVLKQDDPQLQSALGATGVRTTTLFPATPERSHPVVMRTPGGNKVRQVCKIGAIPFFQPLSPYVKGTREGRIDVRDASKSRIQDSLPQLEFVRAEPVEFIATRELLQERVGAIRRNKPKTSASNVFRAHGIEIAPSMGRSYHWAHLIAHFLGDTQDICTENDDKEIINVVPSTAEANYNTLEAIELFIRKKLVEEAADQIHIKVTPQYSGESLIPDLLIYNLNWKEQNVPGAALEFNEVFYINPQSYQRITKSMHESIAVVRKHRSNMVFFQSQDENNDDNILVSSASNNL